MPEVDIGGREVAQVLVIAPVIVVFDEGGELGFEITGQIVALQQDAVLEGLVPALDLALGLGMLRYASGMLDALLIEPFGQIAGDIAGSIIRQQPGLMDNLRPIAARCLEGQFQRVGDVFDPHRRAELPGDDIAREVVEDGREIEPAPTDDLEVGEVDLPQLIGSDGLVLERICRFHHHKGRAGDQVVRLKQPVDRSF